TSSNGSRPSRAKKSSYSRPGTASEEGLKGCATSILLAPAFCSARAIVPSFRQCVAYTRAPRVGPGRKNESGFHLTTVFRAGWEAPCPAVSGDGQYGPRLRGCQAVIYKILCAFLRAGASNGHLAGSSFWCPI